jgi:hypothetical protein
MTFFFPLTFSQGLAEKEEIILANQSQIKELTEECANASRRSVSFEEVYLVVININKHAMRRHVFYIIFESYFLA